VSKQGCYSYLASLSHLINTHPCYVPFSFIISSDNELPPVSSFKKTSLRRRDFSNFNFTEHPRIATNISLALGVKCYPSSTHNFTLEKRCRRIPRRKYIRKKIRDRVWRVLGRGSTLPIGIFNTSGICASSFQQREEKQGRLCASGSRNRGGWVGDFLRILVDL